MIVVFEIHEEHNLQDQQIEKLVKDSSLFVLCKEWQWRRGIGFEHIIIPPLSPEEGTDEETSMGDTP